MMRRRLYVALDLPSAAEARAIVRTLGDLPVGFKAGLQLIHAEGPHLLGELAERAPLVVDAKLHDIPATVERACLALGRLGAEAVTLHALGGREMVRRGVDALARAAAAVGLRPSVALAVTILTSHDEAAMRDELGLMGAPAAAVARLGRLAVAAGAAGVVCAPTEAAAVRAALGPTAVVLTPGVRPAPVAGDDQRRVAGPGEAIAAGASAIVVGRPILAAPDPRAAALAILAAIDRAEVGAP
jgi:orotidine-5'-phosphate decarboxylase